MNTEESTPSTEQVTSLPPPAKPKPEPKKPKPTPDVTLTDTGGSVEPPRPAPEPVVSDDSTTTTTITTHSSSKSAPTTAKPQSQVNVALQKLKSAADIEAYQWINQIAGETEINIAISRKEPEWFRDPNTGANVKVNGTVATFNRTFTEKEIQEKYGGGTYQYIIKTKNARGQWEYFGSKTVEIAGDPNIENIPRTKATPTEHHTAPAPAPDPSAGKAMDALIGIMGQQLNRPQPTSSGPSGVELAQMIERAVATATAPLLATITSLTAQLELKDKALETARNAPPDAFRDMMMKSIMTEQDGRIASLRAQFESEVRTLKENHREDEKRRQDEWNRERDRIEKAHERELSALKLANDAASISSKGMADITKTVLEAENKRLVAEVSELRTENKELAKTKNPSVKEKVDEMNSLKELFGGDEEDKGTLATLMEVLGNLPVVAKLADKIGGPPEVAAAQPAAQPQRQRLVRNAAGEVFRQTADGLVPAKKKPALVERSDGGGAVEIPALDPETVKMAVNFMEQAYKNGTEPKTFAEGARPHVGPSILQAMRSLGIADFLTKVAKVDGNSQLMTQKGRNWSKAVATFLIEGSNSDEATPPAE